MSLNIFFKHLLKSSKLRPLTQLGFLLFSILIGFKFYGYYLWRIGESQIYSQRPPAVEAFLPISALMGLKRLVLTGKYDPIHPAGLTIFIAILTLSFLWKRAFCGWICPIGAISNLIERITKKMVKPKFLENLPKWIEVPLFAPKYLILFFFLYTILWQMDIRTIEAFIKSPYNQTVDLRMLEFFLHPSNLSLWIIIGIIIASIFIKNFWCRVLCPYGALLGILGIFSPTAIKREESMCRGCKNCDYVCPAVIRVSKKKRINSAECIGCFECVSNCREKDVLKIEFLGFGPISGTFIGILAVLTLLSFWVWGRLSGHWFR